MVLIANAAASQTQVLKAPAALYLINSMKREAIGVPN
jgi:hypothetical protein